MHRCVAPTAQCKQVSDGVVPLIPWACRSVPIYMVNVQIGQCAAVLAGVLVSIQCLRAVSAKVISVLCLGSVLRNTLGVLRRPTTDVRYGMRGLAVPAPLLWSCRIDEILAAVLAKQGASNGRRPALEARGSQSLCVGDPNVARAAGWTHNLMGAGGFVRRPAGRAHTRRIARTGLPVRLKRAWLATLQVWRGLLDGRPAAWALQHSISSHGSNSKFERSHSTPEST